MVTIPPCNTKGATLDVSSTFKLASKLLTLFCFYLFRIKMIEGNHQELRKRRHKTRKESPNTAWLVHINFFHILWCLLVFVHIRVYMEHVMFWGFREESIYLWWLIGQQKRIKRELKHPSLKVGVSAESLC